LRRYAELHLVQRDRFGGLPSFAYLVFGSAGIALESDRPLQFVPDAVNGLHGAPAKDIVVAGRGPGNRRPARENYGVIQHLDETDDIELETRIVKVNRLPARKRLQVVRQCLSPWHLRPLNQHWDDWHITRERGSDLNAYRVIQVVESALP
jgi:hypothetical protein